MHISEWIIHMQIVAFQLLFTRAHLSQWLDLNAGGGKVKSQKSSQGKVKLHTGRCSKNEDIYNSSFLLEDDVRFTAELWIKSEEIM